MLWGSNLILLNGRWGPTVCLQRPRQRKLSQSQVVVVISTKRVSAAAVARAVGVSPATVSYALNGRAGVSRDVRVRILETAESMGHTQSSKKYQQVDKQTRVLGLVVTDIMNPFYTEIAAGVIDESRRHGYEVFLAHTQECPQMLASTVEAMIERRVDGVVLAVLHPDDGNVIRALRRAQTPFVQLSRRIEHIDADFVGIDDTAAATSIMEHVLSHGYSNIATITGPRNSSASAAREDAFAATAFVNGISPAENRRVRTYLSEEGGLRAVQELLTDGKAPQAIVCGSDAIALGVLSGLRVHRGGLTALTLTALLLERNTFNDPSEPEKGLAGFGIALTIAGAGVFFGAFLAPYGVRKVGRHRWIKLAMFASAASPLILAASQTPVALSATAFLTAFFGQNLKVTNDALVQSKIDDYYRGRVFAVYDVVVNGAIVSGGLIAALLLPSTGVSAIVPLCVSAAYLLVAAVVLRPSRFKAIY